MNTPEIQIKLSPEELHILQHSLGLDQYGHGTSYRNRFVTDPDSTDGHICIKLCGFGMMFDHGSQLIAGGMHCYSVTLEGRKAVMLQSPESPRLTRAKKRYREWLNADCGIPFVEWLKR